MTVTNASWAKNTSGDWVATANWAGGVIPGAAGILSSADSASLTLPGPYTVTVAATGPWSIGSVAIASAGATLLVGSGGLDVAGTIAINAGTLLLAGTLAGGTVMQGGGTLAVQPASFSAALNSVTLDGTLDLSGAGQQLKLVGTNQFLNATGTGPGRILLTGGGTTLSVTDSETLTGVALTLGSATSSAAVLQLGSFFAQSLTLGSGAAVSVTGRGLISNLVPTVSKQVLNAGSITVTQGALLEIGSQVQLAAATTPGTLAIQSGGTLQLDGSYTTRGLNALVTSDAGAVVIDGLLDNSGAGLVLAPGGALPLLVLQGGTLRGGTVQLAGGALRLTSGGLPFAPAPSTLDGVTVQGTLDLSAAAGAAPGANQVLVRNGLALRGSGGVGQGTILLTGAGQALLAADTETLDNAAITLGNPAVAATLGAVAGGALTLGSHATVAVSGLARIAGGTFANNGTVQLSPGARLQVAAGTALGTSSGTLSLAAGSTVELDGTATTAALRSLVTTAGGVIELDGTLANAAQILAVQPGAFGAVLLRGGTIQGGTLQLAGGSFQVAGGTGGASPQLDGVALQGTLDLTQPLAGLAGTYLGLHGGVSYAGAGGTGQGAILLAGAGTELRALDQETLANVTVALGSSVLGTAAGGGYTVAPGASIIVTGRAQVGGSGSFTNNGAIQVGPGARLDLGAGVSLGSSTGTITVAGGGTLAFDGSLTTAALLGLAGPGTVAVAGVLDNTGRTLQLGPGGALANLTLEGGTLRGGTLSLSGSSPLLTSAGTQLATLDGVTVQGALAPMGGSLALLDGTQIVAADGSAGQLDATRLSGSLTITGALDRVAVALGGGRLQAGATGLQLGSASALSLGAGATVAGSVTDAGNVTLSGGAAAFTGSFSNTGSITVTGGTLSAANLTNAGTITLDGGSALQLAGAAVLGGSVAFGTRANKLAFGAAGFHGATLQGFRFGDSVDLGGVAYGPALAAALQGNVLQVLRGATAVASFTLQGGTYGAGQFSLGTDGAGGTLLTTQFGPQPPDSTGPGTDFDRAWYLAQHPDVAAAGLDPLAHYLTTGWTLGYDPSPGFSTNYYLAQNPDVARAGVNPLIHYEQFGWKEGRDPSAQFSTRGYLATNPDVASADIDPLHHFLAFGRFEGRQPVAVAPTGNGPQDPLVAGAWFLAQYPDAVASGLDPTRYYNTVGWRLGENPNPWFDTKYYLTANPDVAHAGVNPLQHFESFGEREGREPSLAFNDQAYLAANPDVAAANVNPLLHYDEFGQSEGRMTFVAGPAATGPADPLVDRAYYFGQLATIVPASVDAAASYDQLGWKLGLNPDPWFDTAYYLQMNPDVAASGVDPLKQFETAGWTQNRDPSATFSLHKYLAAYPDVATSGVNPLTQFLSAGQAQGRQAFHV